MKPVGQLGTYTPQSVLTDMLQSTAMGAQGVKTGEGGEETLIIRARLCEPAMRVHVYMCVCVENIDTGLVCLFLGGKFAVHHLH